MKILWVKTDFLHPPTRGGQIRTLEMLRHLRRRHEIHYVAFETPSQPEGVARSGEYSTRAYPVAQQIPDKRSLAFAAELALGWVTSLPVTVRRYRSPAMRRVLEGLLREQDFDALVCDFIFPGVNLPEPARWTVFQHNVETIVWRRHAETAKDPLRRLYFGLQARRMFEFERWLCLAARKVVAVTDADVKSMRELFSLSRVAAVSTGVDTEYFAGPASPPRVADLEFVGSMDWMANIDGASWFLDEVLPRIRRRKPECSLAIVGRNPPPALVARLERKSGVMVTGTVPDVRPYLWGSSVSIVPLRVGSGTRLKIFEAMAAGIPVVSTAIGAEGLPVRSGETLLLADTAEAFAARCVELLADAQQRERLTRAAHDLVASRYSWDAVAREFERQLIE